MDVIKERIAGGDRLAELSHVDGITIGSWVQMDHEITFELEFTKPASLGRFDHIRGSVSWDKGGWPQWTGQLIYYVDLESNLVDYKDLGPNLTASEFIRAAEDMRTARDVMAR